MATQVVPDNATFPLITELEIVPAQCIRPVIEFPFIEARLTSEENVILTHKLFATMQSTTVPVSVIGSLTIVLPSIVLLVLSPIIVIPIPVPPPFHCIA